MVGLRGVSSVWAFLCGADVMDVSDERMMNGCRNISLALLPDYGVECSYLRQYRRALRLCNSMGKRAVGTIEKNARCLCMECNCAGTQQLSGSAFDTSLLEPYLEQYGGPGAKGNLIAILQKAQDVYGYLPTEILVYIARRIGVKPAKIMSVVSFYTQFRMKPVGKHLILLCQGTACHVNGSALIEEAIKDTLGVEEGDISANGLFTYTNVACIGCCSLAPVMMIGDKAYGGLTKDKAVKILKDIELEEASE